MLPAVALALAVQAVCGFGICRIVTDATLIPGANEIQGIGPHYRVTQTFTPPQEPIAGVELMVSRHPKTRPLDIMIRVAEGDRELGCGLLPIPSGAVMPVRLAFPATAAGGKVTIEAWAPQGCPGHTAGIQFYPVDHYHGGQLAVGGRPVTGDAVFRVLAPDSSRFVLQPGLDFSMAPGRFPSEDLGDAGFLAQEFVVPMDSLAGIVFVAGTGGATVGPPLRWELLLNSRMVREGRVEAIRDNAPIIIDFPPLLVAEGLPLTLRLTPLRPGEVRVWLCGRMPGTSILTTGDRTGAGSLALTTLHLARRADSLRVVLAADTPLLPEPGLLLVGSCVLTQSFLWPRESTAGDLIGLRLAQGEWTAPGCLAYQVRDDERGEVVYQDSVGLAGRGSDDYLWLRLGGPHQGRRLSVSVTGSGATTDAAPRFWWMPSDVYGEGEARGCVPRPGGDCVFRLATRHAAGDWLRELPRVAGTTVPGRETALVWLLGARLGLMVMGTLVLVAHRITKGTLSSRATPLPTRMAGSGQ
ncbi:hypothetical protein JXA88_01575 [Candidatus Fermentibacteria bacterium]|nr:hypothetical protein [Candidatus Fermentibacteria bacterium]